MNASAGFGLLHSQQKLYFHQCVSRLLVWIFNGLFEGTFLFSGDQCFNSDWSAAIEGWTTLSAQCIARATFTVSSGLKE